ncbi:MAG: DUF3413 domain-containing protein [Bacteroidales bacterium]
MSDSRRNLFSAGAWFYLANVAVAVIISLRYLKYCPFEGNPFLILYIGIAAFSHFATLIFISYMLIYLPFVLIFPNRKSSKVLMVTLCSISIILLLLDTFIYDLYRFHINGFVLDMVFGGDFTQIFVFSTAVYLKSFALVVTLIGVESLLAFFVWRLFDSNMLTFGKISIVFLFVMLLSTHFIHAWAGAALYNPVLKASRFFPAFYPLQASDAFYKYGLVDSEKARNQLSGIDFSDNVNLNYPIHPMEFDTGYKPQNILFIVLDSWNYQAMNHEITPNISAFADSSISFTNHYSGSNGTRGGIFSIFYGLPALYWTDFEAENRSCVLMDEILRRNYNLGIFASASLLNPPFERTVFRNVKKLRFESKGAKVTDREVEITNEWLGFTETYINKQDNRPFFGFLFYDAPHSYECPPNFKSRFLPSWEYADYSKLTNSTDPTPFFNLYKNCVNFDDSLVGLVINDLKKKHLLENTLVIITGDHGQEFNENHHNFWGHNGNYSKAQIGVPMIYWENGRQPCKVSSQTTHYDIVPTLLSEVLFCKNPFSDYTIGKSLFDTKARTWHISGNRDDFGIIIGNLIYTFDFNGSVTVTNTQMDDLDNTAVNSVEINKVMKEVNSFYCK